MTKHKQLLEDYEDALFRVFVDQIATKEGELLIKENELLVANPNSAVPESVDYKCRRLIKHSFRKQRRQNNLLKTQRAVASLAIVFFVISLLFTSAYALVPEVRVWTLNLLINVSDVATSLTLADDFSDNASSVLPNDSYGGYVFPDTPEGFSITSVGNDGRTAWIKYINDESKSISIDISGSPSTVLNIDTEDADSVANISIHGFEGLLIEKENKVHIVWADTEHSKYINIVCLNINKEIALVLAESMRP